MKTPLLLLSLFFAALMMAGCAESEVVTLNGTTIYAVFAPIRGGGLFGGSRDGFWAVEYRQDGNCFSDACGRKFCASEYSIEPYKYHSSSSYLGGVCLQKFSDSPSLQP